MNTKIEALTEGTGVDISVVIPSYNHARFIIQAVESVLNQSHKNWEIILVDDGSTDSTREILDQRYRDHKQIQLVYQSNHGAHHALNQGIALARGRYLSILNSDDIYHPDRLKTLLTYCDANLSGLAITPVTPVNADGAEILALDHPWCQLYAQLMHIYRQSGAKVALLTGNFAVTSSNFFISTDLIQKLGGFRKKRYNHDWDLMARVLRQEHGIECVGQQSLLSYRIHDGNTITQNTLKARLELKQILQSFVPQNEPYLAKLLSQIQINMRSIRHEHQARVVQKIREGYDLHIQKMLEDVQAQHEQAFSQEQARYQKAQAEEQALHQANLTALQTQHQAQIDVLNQTQNTLLLQISAQEHHLTNILNSRSYQFAQFLSRNFTGVKKLLGLLK